MKFETLQIHAGNELCKTDTCVVPIYQTAAYLFDNSQHAADRFALKDAGNIYGRLTNPTQSVLEERMAKLEGGVAALAVASGAAAVAYSIQNIAGNGDHIVVANNIYGGSYNLIAHTLKSQGIDSTFVEPHNEAELVGAIKKNTKLVFVETFGNPNSDVIDISRLAYLAHGHGIPLIVDNTFATPYNMRPIEFGADIVVHSATKFLCGHGTTLGGIIVDSGNFDWRLSDKFPTLAKPDPSYHGAVFAEVAGKAAFVTRIRAVLLRDTGACISPFNAWLILQGLETLSLRMERHGENAVDVAKFLASHPKVEKVSHPVLESHPDHGLYLQLFPAGDCSIFTFDIKGGEEATWRFMDRLKLFSLLANVGDAKSLVVHPASTTHSQLSEEELREQGISQSTIRLSIGLENIKDIIHDLSQALDGED